MLVERTDESVPRKLSVPERSERFEVVSKRLVGLSIRNRLEPADSLVDAFATCCVSVCALQTRVLGILCVPSSGETRALLSFISVISICLFFPREKRCKIFEKFWDVFYPLFGRLYLLHA